MHSLRQRINARDESGFTLIELLVVLIIIGVLLAIAVPAYLGFKDRAVKTQVQANVREAIPDAEAYFQDVGNYTNMKLTTGDAPDGAGLQGIDKGLPTAWSCMARPPATACPSPTPATAGRARSSDLAARFPWPRAVAPCTTATG